MEVVDYNNFDSITFCCISIGIFNFPQEIGPKIAIGTVDEYLKSNETSLKHVIFNVFTDSDYLIYKKEFFGDSDG